LDRPTTATSSPSSGKKSLGRAALRRKVGVGTDPRLRLASLLGPASLVYNRRVFCGKEYQLLARARDDGEFPTSD
jgi:hypothetical protein